MKKIFYFIAALLFTSCLDKYNATSLENKIPCDSIVLEDRFLIRNDQGIEVYVDSITFVNYCKKYCEDNGMESYWE